jgi:hypothetical protein
MSITPEDIRAYVSARWKAASCARCGAADWASGEIENLNGLLPLGKPQDTTLGQTRETLPLAWLICAACGHVEMVALRAIEHWKAGGGGPQRPP